jgi:hypothetical protein
VLGALAPNANAFMSDVSLPIRNYQEAARTGCRFGATSMFFLD